jgi:hypothetical protein
MKKILFLAILAIGLIFTACDPMHDINSELDDAFEGNNEKALFLKDKAIAPDAYMLADEDYELSSNESVSKYKNFSSYDPANENLPEILNQLFSADDAQSMMVTYNYYSKPFVDKDNAYTITEADYTSMGKPYGSFSDEDAAESLIGKLFDRIMFADAVGAEMTAEFLLYTKYEDRFIRVNEDGTSEEVEYTSDAVVVDSAIFEATGNGKYKNFYTMEDALEDLATYATDNGTAPVTYSALVYKNYMNNYFVYLYNGTNWIAKQSMMPVEEELNYALDEDDITQSYWWADPAVKIALGSDDYAVYPETAKYGNFDLRSGNTPGTDTAKLVEMLGGMLDANHNPVEDQQYLVSYAYYDGSNGVGNMRMIKQGGTWSEYSE